MFFIFYFFSRVEALLSGTALSGCVSVSEYIQDGVRALGVDRVFKKKIFFFGTPYTYTSALSWHYRYSKKRWKCHLFLRSCKFFLKFSLFFTFSADLIVEKFSVVKITVTFFIFPNPSCILVQKNTIENKKNLYIFIFAGWAFSVHE